MAARAGRLTSSGMSAPVMAPRSAGTVRAARPRVCTTTRVPPLDGHLIAKAQSLDGGVEDGAISPGVEQRPKRHVTGNAREAIEVGDRHARVLLMCTSAALIGIMLAGRLATRTDTAATLGRARTRSAILAASVSSSLTESPSIVSLAIARAAL